MIENMQTNPTGNFENLESSDPRDHVRNIQGMLDQLITHLRQDVSKVDDPRAEALFETTAEVLQGLKNAFQHFGDQSEAAWRS